MTDTQHTPGPWDVCPQGRLTPGATVPILAAPDAEGLALTVATVRTIGPEGDADAHLIAAAPDLLAALEDVLCCVEFPNSQHKAQVQAAREAIAKARGS